MEVELVAGTGREGPSLGGRADALVGSLYERKGTARGRSLTGQRELLLGVGELIIARSTPREAACSLERGRLAVSDICNFFLW